MGRGGTRRTRAGIAALAFAAAAAGLIWGASTSSGPQAPRPALAEGPPTLYVDRDGVGGDCKDGRGLAEAQSAQTPLCTIERAIQLAKKQMTITVRRGSYPALSVDGGSRSDYVTVRAQSGERVVLPHIEVGGNASFLRFSGFTLTGDSGSATFVVREEHAHHIALLNSSVTSHNQDAVDVRWGASDILIQGNTIQSSPGGNGISLTSTSDFPGVPYPDARAPITNMTIRNNRIGPVGTDAIRPANFVNLLVEGNDISGVIENGDHNDAIQVVWGGKGFVFRNNYVHDNEGQGFFIKDGRVWDVTLENNIIANNRKVGVQVHLFDTIGVRMFNNTVVNNTYGVLLREDVKDAVLRNNVLDDLQVEDPAAQASEIDQDYNVVSGGYNWGAHGPHDIKQPARFVNPSAGDFRLAARSPGIDAAASRGGAPARDKVCRARFQDPSVADRGVGDVRYGDMGALERRPDSAASDTAASCGTRLSVVGLRARVNSRGRTRIRLACAAGASRCKGRLTLSRRSGPKTVRFATARFSLAPGKRTSVRVRLRRSARKRLARAKHRRLNVLVVARAGSSVARATVRLSRG